MSEKQRLNLKMNHILDKKCIFNYYTLKGIETYNFFFFLLEWSLYKDILFYL